MFLLIAFLDRRRRDEREPGLVPAGAAMSAGAGAAAMTMGPTFAETRGVAAAVVASDTPPEEAAIPRWRRPSVKAARQTSDRSAPVSRAALRFREPAASGTVRAIVGYRLVRVSSEPDEVASDEVGRVDRGDEVEIMHEEGSYVLIRTPDDTVGWVHRTTLQEPEPADAADDTPAD